MRMMVTMVKMTRFKFVARAEPERRQRVQPVYRPSAFPEARSGAIIIIILFINIISRMMINITQSHVVNTTREAVVEVESFPKPDFPDMMSNMEMSDMADFELDFEPNKYQAKV